jgi:hypothetical protein
MTHPTVGLFLTLVLLNLHLNLMPFDDEPTLFTSVGNEVDRVRAT